jgi:hypothetical protein
MLLSAFLSEISDSTQCVESEISLRNAEEKYSRLVLSVLPLSPLTVSQ